MNKVTQPNTPIDGPVITEYCQPANLRALARAVITQAVRDLNRKQDPVLSVSSLLWLTDERSSFDLFREVMDAPLLDPYKLLSSGNARRLVGKL